MSPEEERRRLLEMEVSWDKMKCQLPLKNPSRTHGSFKKICLEEESYSLFEYGFIFWGSMLHSGVQNI